MASDEERDGVGADRTSYRTPGGRLADGHAEFTVRGVLTPADVTKLLPDRAPEGRARWREGNVE